MLLRARVVTDRILRDSVRSFYESWRSVINIQTMRTFVFPAALIRIMINRTAVILSYRQPFFDWLERAAHPTLSAEFMAKLSQDQGVYLIEAEDLTDLQDWLQENHDLLFDEELERWSQETASWPQQRDFALFSDYFHVRFALNVRDTGHTPLIDSAV